MASGEKLEKKTLRIPQQWRSLCSFLFFLFLWSFRQNFTMPKDLPMESRKILTENCAPIQCTVWPRNVKNNFIFLFEFFIVNVDERKTERTFFKYNYLRTKFVIRAVTALTKTAASLKLKLIARNYRTDLVLDDTINWDIDYHGGLRFSLKNLLCLADQNRVRLIIHRGETEIYNQ